MSPAGSALICLVLSVTPSLDRARKHLDAGKFEEVFLDLEHQRLSPAESLPAADLLASASRGALEARDGVLAMSLSGLSLKLAHDHPGALEAASRAARSLEQFDQAEAYADRWVKAAPASAEARLCRAELALEAADWQVALDRLAPVGATGPLAVRAAAVRQRAQAELNARAGGPVSELDKRLAAAAADSRRTGFEDQARASPRRDDVVVYSTSWCGACRGLRVWLKHRRIEYTDKDIEKDPAAAAELTSKAKAAGIEASGVPITDVRGTLVVGFDPERLGKLF